MTQVFMNFLHKLCLCVLFVIVTPSYLAMAQENSETMLYEARDTLEIVIPRVFDKDDIGKAYVKSVTGLQGERVVNGTIMSRIETSYKTIFHKFTNGLVLNAWGTGLGMYDKGLPVDTDTRRAQLTIMKITRSDRLSEAGSYVYAQGTSHPLLLTGIDYGYSFNLSISGPRSRFTNRVYEQLNEAIANEEAIYSIIREHDLSATFALRGIRSKTPKRQIPVNWDELTKMYDLGEPVTVFGQYVLRKDLKAQTIIWP